MNTSDRDLGPRDFRPYQEGWRHESPTPHQQAPAENAELKAHAIGRQNEETKSMSTYDEITPTVSDGQANEHESGQVATERLHFHAKPQWK